MEESKSVNPNPKLYQFFNGFETVFLDPYEVSYRYDKYGQSEEMREAEKWINQAERKEDGEFSETVSDSEKDLYWEAMHMHVPRIKNALEVPDFNKSTGQGLSAEEIIDSWTNFIEWQNGVKKNTDELPTDVNSSA